MLDRPGDSAPSASNAPLAAPSAHHDALPGSLGDLLMLIGRIAIGQLYVVSGYGKITALSVFAAGLTKDGVPAPDVMAVIGASVEFFGGLALVLGLKTRWAGALLVLFTIFATLLRHRYWEFEPPLRGGQYGNFYKNITITGGLLFVVVAGGGRFSIDGLLGRSR